MNKIVRFIYQGQFLCDKNTVKSYNIKDQTTIHCHITTKPQHQQQQQATQVQSTLDIDAASGNPLGTFNNQHHQELASGLRLREVNPIVSTMTPNNQTSTGLINSNMSNTGVEAAANVVGPRVAAPNVAAAPTIINIDLNNLLLPFFAGLLGVSWYFRVNFKHFFSPLSTLILVIFTFIYALFLFNNIHSTSSIAANNFMMHSRILRRRQIRAQPQPIPQAQ